jgi:hypothetical protein
MGNMHLVHVATVLAFFAFQLHILTMTLSNYKIYGAKGTDFETKDNVIQAFVILAYALFIIGLILSVMMTRSGLAASNFAAAITAVILLLAAGSVVIFLAVYNDYDANTAGPTTGLDTYWISTYSVGGACGLVAGTLLLVALCC